MNYRKDMSTREYYEQNKEWIQKIALSSDIVLRSMALAVIEVATKHDQ